MGYFGFYCDVCKLLFYIIIIILIVEILYVVNYFLVNLIKSESFNYIVGFFNIMKKCLCFKNNVMCLNMFGEIKLLFIV